MAPPRRKVGSGAPPKKKGKTQPSPATAKAAAQVVVDSSRTKYEPVKSRFGAIQFNQELPPISSLPPGDRISREIPMAFRSSLQGRANFQYAADPEPFQTWISEWMQGIDRKTSPFNIAGLHKLTVQVDWRLLSNSGMEPDLIRPVLGAGGWPVVPGSSIKGMFLRACNEEQKRKWCGWCMKDKELANDSLRFHGAWPTATMAPGEAYAQWCSAEGNLLDLTHPQQEWQCGETWGNESHSAYSLVSLFKPELIIGISSRRNLAQTDWDEIDSILRRALLHGIGGRTAAGYGSSTQVDNSIGVAGSTQVDRRIVFQCDLEGQGMASVLLSKQPELRPTMFRAAIRGMALRLFGGLTTGEKAHAAVDQLFGGIGRGGAQVGLLAMSYKPSFYEWGLVGDYGQPVYITQGTLCWRMTSQHHPSCTTGNGGVSERDLVITLLAQLHGLVMALGGFGKCWRRPDHRIFFAKYQTFPIGCHWQWRKPLHDLDAKDPLTMALVRNRVELGGLISSARQSAKDWLNRQGLLVPGIATWREVIDPVRMLIWTRMASGPKDAQAIHWFHRDSNEHPEDPFALKLTSIGGGQYKIGGQTRLRVGTAWNRMLPLGIGERNDASPTRTPQLDKPQSHAAAFERVHPKQRSSPSNSQRADHHRGRDAKAVKRPPPDLMKYWEADYLESFTLFVKESSQSSSLIKSLDSLAKDGSVGLGEFRRLEWD